MEKVLLVANSFAGSVSERARDVIVKALSADCELEVVETARRDHASELAADAVAADFGVVIAFGGDGTINEVAQALVGTDVALGILPGGSTNVMARSLGLPRDPIESTAVVGAALRARARRVINVGRINDRYFLFSAGMGLDAQVVKEWEAHPEWRGAHHDYHFLKAALKAGSTRYRAADPTITLEVEGADPARVLLAICCNGRPFTYFKRWPVDVCPRARLDAGLDFFAIERIRATTIPRIIWGVFVSRSHVRWRHSHYHHDVSKGRMTADSPLPVQVDGDYIGEHDSAEITSVPGSLSLLL